MARASQVRVRKEPAHTAEVVGVVAVEARAANRARLTRHQFAPWRSVGIQRQNVDKPNQTPTNTAPRRALRLVARPCAGPVHLRRSRTVQWIADALAGPVTAPRSAETCRVVLAPFSISATTCEGCTGVRAAWQAQNAWMLRTVAKSRSASPQSVVCPHL